MRRGQTALPLLRALAFLLFVTAGAVRASTNYPAGMEAQIPLTYAPQCSICHAGGDTDAGPDGLTGTVTTPFGTTMVMFGLLDAGNIPSLDGALEGLEAEMSPYIGYLQDGLDPNNPTQGTVPPITYGCFNVTGQGRVGGPAGLFLLGLALLFLLRARRTPAPR